MLAREGQPSSARVVVIHLHIFKNGGTSFDHALKREFGRGFSEFDGDQPRYVHLPEEIAAYLRDHPHLRALSSHHLRYPLPEMSDMKLLPALFLRHPLDRMRSIYRYERNQRSKSPGSIHAKKFDFPDYVRWRLDQGAANLLCNYHASVLTCNPRQGLNIPDPELARKRLRETTVCGTVERLEDTLALAELRLQEYFPGIDLATTPMNVSSGRKRKLEDRIEEARKECGEELFADVAAGNALDLELHALAEELLQLRIDALDDGPVCLEAYRSRCRQLA